MSPAKPVLVAVLLPLAAAFADGGPAHRVRQTPPVRMGTSGGQATDASNAFCCGGTLGAVVLYDGVVHILSNNHVIARSGSAPVGDDTIQPALIDTSCRTTNVNIVADFPGNLVPLGTANVDAAISRARAGMVDETGYILDIGAPCSTILPPAVNLQVMKSGRTTGITTGRITSINTSVSIQYQAGCNQGRKFTIGFTNQVVTTNMSAGGDSGSVLLANDGSARIVGLLFAGSSTTTIHNPAQHVVNAFSAGGHSFSFVGSNCPRFADEPIPGPADADIQRALAVKVQHEHDLMRLPGVWGVGVGCTEADPNTVAIVVYMEKPAQAPDPRLPQAVPPRIDGIDTRIIWTDPFVAH